MKLAWFKKPTLYILAGLVGLALCALFLYIAQYTLEAPDPSTLSYRQSQWFFGALLWFILAVAALARGVWGIIRERRARQLDKMM